MKWFFTFSSAHVHNNRSLGKRYVVIEGSFNEAREKMFAVRGPRWSFQYDVAKLKEQVFNYRLTEITLEELAE